MVKYEKPVVETAEGTAEGVYLASGEVNRGVCPYGRQEASAGADICQICSKTDGKETSGQAFTSDYNACPPGAPENTAE